jgi:hypothetical protein
VKRVQELAVIVHGPGMRDRAIAGHQRVISRHRSCLRSIL